MKSSKNDIFIESDEFQIYFSYLEWDSHFFKCPCYYINLNKSSFRYPFQKPLRLNNKFQNAFISTKLDAKDFDILCLLQESGFRYISNELILGHDGIKRYINLTKCHITEITQNTNLPYDELGAVFNYSRFHLDSKISKEKADQLWISYLKNYVPGKHHHMFIAKKDDDIAGVILANKYDDYLNLFYVAIKEKYQNSGIGTLLINEIINNYNFKSIRTETITANINAINYYIKNGFNILINSKVILHRWSNDVSDNCSTSR